MKRLEPSTERLPGIIIDILKYMYYTFVCNNINCSLNLEKTNICRKG